MGNTLIVIGIFVVIAGILLNTGWRPHFPLLPGDIFYQKDGFTFYFPIVTSIIVSIVLTIIFSLFR